MNKNFAKLVEAYKEKLNHNPCIDGPGFSHLYLDELEFFCENISEAELERLIIENADRVQKYGADLYDDICLMVADMTKCNTRVFNHILKQITTDNFNCIIMNKNLSEENIYAIIETGCIEKISKVKDYLTFEMKEIILELYDIRT